MQKHPERTDVLGCRCERAALTNTCALYGMLTHNPAVKDWGIRRPVRSELVQRV